MFGVLLSKRTFCVGVPVFGRRQGLFILGNAVHPCRSVAYAITRLDRYDGLLLIHHLESPPSSIKATRHHGTRGSKAAGGASGCLLGPVLVFAWFTGVRCSTRVVSAR